MSTAQQASAPAPVASVASFSQDQISKWEQGVALTINNWRALSDAVSCQWGGPDSADKRDWLCGAVADLFVERPDTDAEDVEEVLLQVMVDEFDVNLEDDSAYLVSGIYDILHSTEMDGYSCSRAGQMANYVCGSGGPDGSAVKGADCNR